MVQHKFKAHLIQGSDDRYLRECTEVAVEVGTR